MGVPSPQPHLRMGESCPTLGNSSSVRLSMETSRCFSSSVAPKAPPFFLTERHDGDRIVKAAIKLIPAAPENSELQLARWRMAAELSHPHLIRLFETGSCELSGMPLLYAGIFHVIFFHLEIPALAPRLRWTIVERRIVQRRVVQRRLVHCRVHRSRHYRPDVIDSPFARRQLQLPA